MICRFLEKKDSPLVEELWDRCFEKKEASFFQYYFGQYCFLYNRVYGGFTESGELMTMLHLNPYTVSVNRKKILALYLCGVATAEKFRGHHYMGSMLNECCNILWKEGISFVFLVPVAEKIFLPCGFVGVDYHIQPSFAEIEKNFTLIPCKIDLRNFVDLYGEYVAEKNGVFRSAIDWSNFLIAVKVENSRAYFLKRNNVICGYVVTSYQNEVIEVISPDPLPQGNKPFVMAKGLQGQDCRKFLGHSFYFW